MNPLFDRVTIVGAGLLGASLGLALQSSGAARHITGVGRRQRSLDLALRNGAVHAATLDLAGAVVDADLIVVATPASTVLDTLDAIRAACPATAVIIDVASTKADICAHASRLWPVPRPFIGCHPMAGSEKSGPEHADAGLYRDSVCLIEESPHLDPAALDRVRAMWTCVGARVVGVDPQRHDRLLAQSSHVPHILATTLAIAAQREGATRDFIGNGFRDMTRIAAGSPEMWRDITMTNRDAIAEGLKAVKAELDLFLDALNAEDAETLMALFQAGKDARHAVVGE